VCGADEAVEVDFLVVGWHGERIGGDWKKEKRYAEAAEVQRTQRRGGFLEEEERLEGIRGKIEEVREPSPRPSPIRMGEGGSPPK